MKKTLFLIVASHLRPTDAFGPGCQPSCRHVRANTRRSVGIAPDQETRLEPLLPLPTATLTPLESSIIKFSMLSYIASMCISLPLGLMPVWSLHKLGLISQRQREEMALDIGEWCAKNLLTIMPFCNVNVTPYDDEPVPPIPSVWCANHVSALDTFLWLATDEQVRGKHKRPLKVIYWKGLEENPVCKILFHNAGFIPVDMAANGSGIPNEYDPKSFKQMLKLTKQAFQDGFDLFLLPEGQLNPSPEKGLLPVFPGAFALAKLAGRPIRLVGIHGTHTYWHADENIGMDIKTKEDVSIRTYPPFSRQLENGEDFVKTFNAVVGHFGKTGHDLPEKALNKWLGESSEETTN